MLVVWVIALAVVALLLGIVGYQLLGQAGRLRRAITGVRRDVAPRVTELGQIQPDPSTGRHSFERRHSRH